MALIVSLARALGNLASNVKRVRIDPEQRVRYNWRRVFNQNCAEIWLCYTGEQNG